MATVCRKILPYVVVSVPKPVAGIVMRAFETDILDVSASIWQILALQSQLLMAKQSKSQLQVGEKTHTCTVHDYLLTGIKILVIVMFPEVLRMRRGERAYSYILNARVFYLHKPRIILRTLTERGCKVSYKVKDFAP